jgi:hypothetical protein
VSRRHLRGVTLIEALVALAVGAVIVTAVAASFRAVVDFQTKVPPTRVAHLRQVEFEDRLRSLLRHAFVDEDSANPSTYFIGQIDPAAEQSALSGPAATELIFTAIGLDLPGAASLMDTTTFEDRNARIGPVGGVAEVRLGTSPLGDPGAASGLFIRRQVPADRDPDQGGFESVFDDRIAAIAFEFWSGSEWRGEWTTETGERRLPAAVRVTYSLRDDEDGRVRTLIVRLDNSDASSTDPAGGSS